MALRHHGADASTASVHKIDGNPADPKSRGMLCARGQGGVSFIYDPDRLQAPMVRTGERGEGKFQEVTWEEALDESAAKLLAIAEEYGPESVAIFGHTSGDFWFTDYFAQAWGTPNAAKPSSSLCTSPREEAANLDHGLHRRRPRAGRLGRGSALPDPDRQPHRRGLAQHGDAGLCQRLGQGRQGHRRRSALLHGGRPRPTTGCPSSRAPTRRCCWPGSTCIINEERYDADYVAEWTEGFDELKAHVQEFTPEWAAAITDLPAELIHETALVMADNLPQSLIMPGRHVTWYGNDTQRMRAVYIINALLGAYGREGGFYFNKSPYIESYPHPPFAVAGSSGGCSAEPGGERAPNCPSAPSGKARADGARTTFLRGATAMQELIEPMITGEPYPIKALIVYGVNLLNSIPDTERTKEALRKLDFVLVIDVLPQEHVAWADVVMPEATSLERYDELWTVAHKTPYIAMREPAIEPMYETKPAWWMVRELGMRVGLEKYFKWETAEEYLNTRLMSVGSSLDKMREQEGRHHPEGQALLRRLQGRVALPHAIREDRTLLQRVGAGRPGSDAGLRADRGAARRLLPPALRAPSGAHLCQDPEHAAAQRALPGERWSGSTRMRPRPWASRTATASGWRIRAVFAAGRSRSRRPSASATMRSSWRMALARTRPA